VHSPYPKVGYQVFYRMEVTQIHRFEGEHESTRRMLINPIKVSDYFHEWHKLYQEILDCALAYNQNNNKQD
jgi:8-oxo-dGTP diphosphatase